jgi:hypothetical protein
MFPFPPHTHTHTHTHTHCTALRGDDALCNRVRTHENTLGTYVPKEEMTERERGLISVFGVGLIKGFFDKKDSLLSILF